jgi:hypothetical protein
MHSTITRKEQIMNNPVSHYRKLVLLILATAVNAAATAASASAATTPDDYFVYNGKVVGIIREAGPLASNQAGFSCSILNLGTSGGKTLYKRSVSIRPPFATPLPGYSSQQIWWIGLLYDRATGQRYYANAWQGGDTYSTAGTEFGGTGDSGLYASPTYLSYYWTNSVNVTVTSTASDLDPYVELAYPTSSGWVYVYARAIYRYDNPNPYPQPTTPGYSGC